MNSKKFEVVKIERDDRQICLTVKAASGRKLEYLLGTNAFYFTDEELKREFETNPKVATERYDAQVNLM